MPNPEFQNAGDQFAPANTDHQIDASAQHFLLPSLNPFAIQPDETAGRHGLASLTDWLVAHDLIPNFSLVQPDSVVRSSWQNDNPSSNSGDNAVVMPNNDAQPAGQYSDAQPAVVPNSDAQPAVAPNSDAQPAVAPSIDAPPAVAPNNDAQPAPLPIIDDPYAFGGDKTPAPPKDNTPPPAPPTDDPSSCGGDKGKPSPPDNPQPGADAKACWGDRQFTVHPDGSADYNVVHGDTVWAVAADVLRFRLAKQPTDADICVEVAAIAKASGLTQNGRNPDLIYPGDDLKVPPPAKDECQPKPN